MRPGQAPARAAHGLSAPHDRRQDLGVAGGQPEPACSDQPLDCSLPALVCDTGHQPLPIGPPC
eukprot:13923728-Alexandrium_andersonii.AAC.1